MTLKKRILLSNILAVILPVLIILGLWAGYVHFNGGTYLKPINRASDGGDLLTDSMNILHTFEAELSGMSWDVTAFSDEGKLNIVTTPEQARLEELEELGYHLQVETADAVSFSNMDESDRLILEKTGVKADGAVIWAGDCLVIQDGFKLMGQDYNLTAVYNPDRADQGVQGSLLPMYMISPTLIYVFLAIVVCCIALTTFLISRWLGRSVLVPLQELKKGADRIAENDLDYRIPYTGRDEFGDVCREFDHMRLQLKEAERKQSRYEEEKRALLRGISHDLRSPLTSIRGYAAGLRDGIADTPEKQQRYLNAILSGSEDMERLIESLSLLVKLESRQNTLHPEKVCLDEYLCGILEENRQWLTEQNIGIDYRNEVRQAEVLLDIGEMQRVFRNLFENTVKYRTADHSKVKLSVLKRNENAEIRFSDDGPGVAAEHLPYLFDSFYRADEARTNPGGGSGIGLAVVKQIIEGLNGRVYACQEEGLCIVMTIPLA